MTNPQWTVLKLLRWTTDYFQSKGVSEPRASAEVLLAHTLALSRLDLYLRYDQPLAPEELARFKALMVRRVKGEPVAYLTGHKEFWSLDFLVTPATLIPRPDTEVLVTAALEAAKDLGNDIGRGGQGRTTPAPSPKPSPPTPYRGLGREPEGGAGDLTSPGPPLRPFLGLEIGVGSGAVVIALARELPQWSWLAVDLSPEALAVAQENARRLEVAGRISFVWGDLLAALRPEARFALLVANLPYVPRAEWEALPRDIKDFEPRVALLGGEDGLALLRPLIAGAPQYLQEGGWLALEVGAGQSAPVLELLEETGAFEQLQARADYQGIARVVRGRRREGAKKSIHFSA